MIGSAKPFVVGMWFSDGAQGYHALSGIVAVSESDAAGRAVSQYYMRGGKLPLVSMSAMEITEETARNALALIEADQAAEKAAAAVVQPFSVVPAEPPAFPESLQPEPPAS